MNQTIEQKRAKYALEKVKDFADKENKKAKEEYKSYASQLPVMICQNGLGQASAFYLSKGGTHKQLYYLLSKWLCKENPIYHKHTDLLDGITKSDQSLYRLAQAEAQTLMQWVVKFAKVYMVGEKEAKE